MTSKARTIDNLGIDASIRYAKDQEQFDAKYIEESRLIPQKTEISSTSPFVPSEFDQKFSLSKIQSWAFFSPPPQDLVMGKSLFSYQLIPSLGTYEKVESDTDKLEKIEDLLKKPNQNKKRSKKDQDEEKEEAHALVDLFKMLHGLDKMLNIINGRRNQYQRG